MAKIRIDNLPEGFELKDGKLTENKQYGGKVTGDQSNYGLVTTNPSMELNQTGSEDVRYSLSKVPRDVANVEAEGGETVLTDLNGDGQFGLYDIKGPRHSNGGVPMYLPEQSFVFSDFNKLKFDKSEMAELGIESKKKKTPAKLSRKFGLNEYYGKLKDPYADSIQIKSAELMMDKNKMKLSQLAFMQETKKDFEDGVPLSSYPFLVSQDIDPIQFTQQVEEISRQKAEEKAIQSLPQQQQMQLAALQEYMEQVNQQKDADELAENDIQEDQMQQQNRMQQQIPEEMMQQMQQPMAQDGLETLPLYQDAGEYSEDKQLNVLLNSLNAGKITPFEFQLELENLQIDLDFLNDFGVSSGAINTNGLELIKNNYQQLNAVDTLYRLQDLLTDPKLKIDGQKTDDKSAFKIILDLQKRIINNDPEAIKELEQLGYNFQELDSGSGAELSLKEIEDLFIPVVNTLEKKFLNKPEYTPPVNPSTGGLESIFEDPKSFISPFLKTAKEYDQNVQDYKDLEAAMLSDDKGWQKTLENAYTKFVNRAKSKGIDDIPSKEDLTKSFLEYQKNNYDVRNITTKEQRFDPNLDKSQSIGLGKNEYTQNLFDRLKQENPEYSGYEIDENTTKANQLFFQLLFDEDQKSNNPQFDVFQDGPEETSNYAKNSRISDAEGFYGNNTLNQLVKVKSDLQINNEENNEGDDEGDDDNNEVNNNNTSPYNFFPKPRKRKSDFWLQDVIKTNAIRNRKREMFLPFQPAVTPVEFGYVLEDPTRAIAAQNEQLNLGAQAMGAFAGPQATSARLASMQGKAAEQIANTIAGVNQRNVNTINRGEMQNSRVNMALAQEERDRLTKLYDDTQVTLQKYMNELNFDREQYANSLANMYTNRANTSNLNQLYDYYQIDPSSGGMVEFTSGESFKKAQIKDADDDLRELARRNKKYKELTGLDLPTAYINKFLGVKNVRATTNAQREMQSQIGNMGYQGNRRQANNQPIGRKGIEMKKYAVPFYAGKMSL